MSPTLNLIVALCIFQERPVMDRGYGSVDKALPSKPSLNPQDSHES